MTGDAAGSPSRLKDEIAAELSAYASELGDIGHEIERSPWGTEEESKGYGARAARVSELSELVGEALVAPLKEGAFEERILAQEPGELPPAYQFEAFLHPPWETAGTGGLVGYSDESEEDAAAQLKLVLRDLLGDGRADGLAVFGPNGEEMRPDSSRTVEPKESTAGPDAGQPNGPGG